MQIQVNTDNNTTGPANWLTGVEELVAEKFRRFEGRITRVEVHMGDHNGASKSGLDDKRCMIEVRIAGLQPLSVSDAAATHDQALRGAANKMQSVIESAIGKLHER